MHKFHQWLRQISAIFQRRQLDADMNEEMRLHVTMRMQANFEAGMPPEAARRRALQQFGWMDSVKQTCREQRYGHRLETFFQDLRFGLRMLIKQPIFSLVSIIVVVIGLAGTTTVLSLYNGMFLRPFPVPFPDRLVDLSERNPKQGGGVGLRYQNFHAWRQHNRTFESMAICSFWASNLTSDDKAERVDILLASHDYIRVLGIRPLLGRSFTVEEDRPGGPNVILLSHHLWERIFGRDPTIVGRSLRLDNDSYTVIGILPPEAAFPVEKAVWRPLCADPVKGHGGIGIFGLGRLKKGISILQAEADLARIQENRTNRGREENMTLPALSGIRERYLHEFQLGMSTLLGVMAFVLLIACCNVTSILLARGAHRSKEIALRVTLGASRRRIIQHVFGESLVISLLGSIGGILLGYWALRAIVASVSYLIPPWMIFPLDLRFAAFFAGLVVIITVLSGLYPALQAARRVNPYGSLCTLSPGMTTSRAKLRTLNTIVTGQIALALILLIGAGLFLRTLRHVQGINPGYQTQGLLTYEIPLPIGPYYEARKRQAFFEDHLAQVRALPGVEHAALCNSLPLGFLNIAPFEMEGRLSNHASEPDFFASKCSVSPGYFATLGVALIRGRALDNWDNHPDSERCVVIDASFAQHFGPEGEAVGQRVRPKGSEHWMRIVGVVQEVKNAGLDNPAFPTVYIPYRWDLPFVTSGVVRTQGDPLRLAAAIRDVVRSADPGLPIIEVKTLEQRIDRSLWGRRMMAWLVSVPAVAAGLMACAGLFGVISYSVSQRIPEFGIRLALGAQSRHLLGLVLRAGLIRISLGIVLGWIGAIGLTQVVRSLLFGIEATDPLTFTMVALLLGGISLAACCLPMYRAARLDPLMALRQE